MTRFSGRTAIVTGAASGIGRATALRLAREGATVACLDVNADAAKQTATEIGNEGGSADVYVCDVGDARAVDAAVVSVVSDHGALHVLCNIAGIGHFAHTHEESLEGWERILRVNLTGTFLMSRSCLPHLLETKGAIVNTASSAGVRAQPYSAAYCASKGGVVQLTKAMAWEYIEAGLRVNAIAPGGIDTPIIQSFGFPEGASVDLFAKITSPWGFGQPEDVAGLFAYMASDEAKYMTGAIVSMDGGITS